MKYPKSRTENNRGAAYLRGREARMAVELEKRSERRVECCYCDVVSKAVVTRLESEERAPYRRGVPCWGNEY